MMFKIIFIPTRIILKFCIFIFMRLNYVIIISLGILFFACKKNYSCRCSINGSYTTRSYFSEKMTKKQAKASCQEIENTTKEIYPSTCPTCGDNVTCESSQ